MTQLTRSSRLPRVGMLRTLLVIGGSLLAIALSFVLSVLDNNYPETKSDGLLSFMLVLGGIAGLLVGIVLGLYSWYHTRRIARTVASNKLLAHWTVSGDSWERYLANERRRTTRDALNFILVAAVITLLLTAWDMFSQQPGNSNQSWSWSDVEMIMFVVICFNVVTWSVAQLQLYLLRRQDSGTVYITTDGVLLGQQWHSWWQLGRSLASVVYKRDPDNELIFAYYKPGSRSITPSVVFHVPVPTEHASDARQVVARLMRD